MGHTITLEQTTGHLDPEAIKDQLDEAWDTRDEAVYAAWCEQKSELPPASAAIMQRAHRAFERVRSQSGSDEGSASAKFLAGVAVVAAVAAGYVAGMYHGRGFTIPGIGLHVPNFFAPKPDVAVKAEAGLTKVEPKDDLIVASGIGYTYADLIYKATIAGPKWSINPSYVKQRGTAIFGTPPPTFTPPSSFKDSQGNYVFSAPPVLQEIVPGNDVHLSLGDRGKKFADANRFYIIATVVDNNIHTQLEGLPIEHSDMNFQARIGNIAANADMGSYTTAAAQISAVNYKNTCGTELAPVVGAGIKEDVARIAYDGAELLKQKGDNGDKEAADEAKFLLAMDDPQSIVVNYVHEVTQTTPSGNTRVVQVPVDTLKLPQEYVDDKESFAKNNGISPKDLTFKVDTTCHMDKATQDKIDAYSKDAIVQPTAAPATSPGSEAPVSSSMSPDLKAENK